MTVQVNRRLIRELRIRRSWSQEKLAEITGVNLRTIQRIETKGAASLGSRAALANAFGMRPEALDPPQSATASAASSDSFTRLPPLPRVLLSVFLVVLGWFVLAVSIRNATPIGIVTLPAVAGLLIALIGFVLLTRLTPLRRRRTWAVLAIVVVAMLASPPAWTIAAFVAISLWAAFELGVLLLRFQPRGRHL